MSLRKALSAASALPANNYIATLGIVRSRDKAVTRVNRSNGLRYTCQPCPGGWTVQVINAPSAWTKRLRQRRWITQRQFTELFSHEEAKSAK